MKKRKRETFWNFRFRKVFSTALKSPIEHWKGDNIIHFPVTKCLTLLHLQKKQKNHGLIDNSTAY